MIEDNGPGFPPDISTRAFERFVRGKHSQGHGLGLAFVDAVIRAHNGTVKISENQSSGAVVVLSLPVNVLHAVL
jgi:signal transduction histidine kinase